MGSRTIVHGRISLEGDFEKSKRFIESLSNDDRYPSVRTEMFTPGAFLPYYYDYPVIGFAASYRGQEDDWATFIIKFENVLRNIDFDTAKIQMETECLGTYNFFWKSKKKGPVKFEEKDKLIETNEWFFGFGYRSRWGSLDEDLKEEHVFRMDFEYPLKFDAITMAEFNEVVKDMDFGQVVYLEGRITSYSKLEHILTYGYVSKMIDFGSDPEKGMWIKKLNDIQIK